MNTKRHQPTIRREMILNAGLSVARRPGGWVRLTRRAIAKEAGCSEALVSRYLGDIQSARRPIMKAAIRLGLTEIIAQSLAAHDGYAVACGLSQSLRTKAISALLGK